MVCFFILSVIPFLLVAALHNEFLIFDNNQKRLQECIEHNLLIDDDYHNKDAEDAKTIAKLIAKTFVGKTLQKSDLNRYASYMYFHLRKAKFLSNHEICSLRAIKEVLIYCANDGQSDIKPDFEDEAPELTKILNFILVDWPMTLRQMINTRKGRMILRRFAEEAQVAFNAALNFIGNRNIFRKVIRETWKRRAHFYFNINTYEFSRLRHRYSINRGLRIQCNIDSTCMTQNFWNFLDRNRVPPTDVEVFLNIHRADRPPYAEHDLFTEYEKNGMSIVEYHIEILIDQFYRTMIFCNDLKHSGLVTDDSDIYFNRPIPNGIMRNDFQQMLYKSHFYESILLQVRTCSKYFDKSNADVGLFLSIPYFVKEHIKLVLSTTTSQYNEQSTQSEIVNDNDFNMDCVAVENHRENVSTNSVINPKYPKYLTNFHDEPAEISSVLDYILVDWPLTLKNMILTRKGRATLRRYAKDAQSLLENALNFLLNYENFRYLLRTLWMSRAQRYYDGYDLLVPYLRYHFTLENPFPHTYDDQTTLLPRSNLGFLNRNPKVPRRLVDKILNVHAMDHTLPIKENDFFNDYEKNGMTSSEYYIEAHIDQFYRILFFFMELELYGIRSDEEDIWDGPLPHDLLPDFIQEIVYSDDSYRNFLLFERRRLQRLLIEPQWKAGQSRSSARVHEESLISMLNLWTSNIAMSTSASASETSTTSQCNQSKRKGSVWVNGGGKHFSKRPKNTLPQSCDNGYQNIDAEVFGSSESSLQTHDDFYGYIHNNNNHNQISVSETELLSVIQELSSDSVTYENMLHHFLDHS